ncbi:rhodanese-like domain-containing protein [Acidaminobacterium chupaoyuni]
MKTKQLKWVAAALAALILGGCAAPQTSKTDEKKKEESKSTAEYHKITAKEAKARMDSGDPVIVVDVRRADEYEAGHIPGAILIPNEEIGTEKPAKLPDTDAEILIYCRSGNRSKQAADKLVAMGYTKVYDFGGIIDWPYDTVTGPEETQPTTAASLFGSFKSEDLEGNAVDESIFSGKKLTMVNIWATYCSPCLREMPELGEIQKEYADKGFQIVGIPIDTLKQDLSYDADQVKKAQKAVEKTGADYTHVLPSIDLIRSHLQEVYAVPETVFVDENGVQVGEIYSGAQSKADWEKLIDSLLKEVEKA